MKRDKTSIILAALLALITAATYLPALNNGFVWDDHHYVLDNTGIRGSWIQTITWSFTKFAAGNWHPLTWLSHAIDIQIWGMEPYGHHMINILLHTINTTILFWLVLSTVTIGTRQQKPTIKQDEVVPVITAAITTLLFGIHPLHVESVVWVAERKDLLCALFYLLSIRTYLKIHDVNESRTPRRTLYLCSVGLFLLALMSKPMAVTLPLVLLILDWYPLNKIASAKTFRSAILEKIPFWVFAFLSSVITVFAQRATDSIKSSTFAPLSTRLLVSADSLVEYLKKFIYPYELIPFYAYPKSVQLFSATYLIPTLLLIFISYLCIRHSRRQPLYLAAWLYYVVTLLPVIGLVQVGEQAMADRYMYLPSIGPCMLIGFGCASFARKTATAAKQKLFQLTGIVFIFMLMVFMIIRTVEQTRIWKDEVVLWTYVLERYPDTFMGLNNRGNTYINTGQPELAIQDFSRIGELYPDYYLAFDKIGAEYGKLGMLDKSIAALDKALAIAPHFADGYINRGTAYLLSGRPDKALDDFTIAILKNPRLTHAYLNRGKLFEQSGNISQAFADYQSACQLGGTEACAIVQSLSGKRP